MKVLPIAILLLVAALIVPSSSAQTTQTLIESFRALDADDQALLIAGAVDMLLFLTRLQAGTDSPLVRCFQLGGRLHPISWTQIRAIVLQRLDRNPADWNQPLSSHIFAALGGVCLR